MTNETIPFAVDAKLLRELGARLVGQPHIAMAELIKNAYDADATHVSITIDQSRIVVADNGHGMTVEDLKRRWMRIGTSEKENEKVSRHLHRPLTGSKGVGRLSVQILADELILESITEERPDDAFRASVNWSKAIQASSLTKATAEVEHGSAVAVDLPDRSRHGTRIVLLGLQQVWDARALRDLAREIWPLQPPFKTDRRRDERGGFTVTLHTGNAEQEREFAEQMDAVLNLWMARLVVKTLEPGTVAKGPVLKINRPAPDPESGDQPEQRAEAEAADLEALAPPDAPGWTRTFQLSLQFAGEERELINYQLDDCSLDRVRFEVRVFNLKNRQPSGISVQDARNYLSRFGGVHVYDAGFHLPYYGPDGDWLHIEMDHSHRRSKSPLLPAELTSDSGVANPMHFLPTNSRLFGQVQVDTHREAQYAAGVGPGAAREALSIVITRDRLRNTQAFRSLVQIVRFAIDFYAIREAQRALEIKLRRKRRDPEGPDLGAGSEERVTVTVEERAQAVKEIIEESAGDLSEPVRARIGGEITELIETAAVQREKSETQLGLLGALATAGITGLAQEHELAKQNALLSSLVKQLRRPDLDRAQIDEIATGLEEVLERAAATRRLFGHLLDERSRTSRGVYGARLVTRTVADQLRPLSRGVPIDTAGVPETLQLPDAGYAEWVAIFQNVYINAFNAMLDQPVQNITVDGGHDGTTHWLRVQDTGSGVDLASADRLFLPFERRTQLSPERERLGLGGTGLGLTIVEMLADRIGVDVRFEEPTAGYATALMMRWGRR